MNEYKNNKQIRLISNPLTMIGVFAGLCEVAGTVVLPFVSVELQKYFIFYIMGLPVLLVCLFFYVLIKHPQNLYAPSDFEKDEAYLSLLEPKQLKQIKAIEALKEGGNNNYDLEKIKKVIIEATSKIENETHQNNRILWVDDNPQNNMFIRKAFEAIGYKFDLALSTKEALTLFSKYNYVSVISDMGRAEGNREGYVLLNEIRMIDKQIPFFIFSGSNLPKHRIEALEKGAQGSTNHADELIEMVTSYKHK